MEWHWWLTAAIAMSVAVGALLVYRPLRATWRQARFEEARRNFHLQRERLEARFVQLGMAPARRNLPRWADCEFEDDVAYARSRTTGELSAFVGVTLDIEPSSDGLTLDGASLRSGTAVFRFHRGRWATDGRAILNLSPTEAIRFYHRDLEMVGQEVVEHL